MSKKGGLFLLVKSLSKSEKRYFKLYAGGKSESNYLRLFDVIDRQEQFDEAAIRKRFKGEAFIRQLHVSKIYLAELILKSLRNYSAGSSVHGRILDLLRDTEILYRKELYDACLQKIEKAEKLSVSYEKTPLLLEILQWKRKLMITKGHTRNKAVDLLLEKEKNTLRKLQDLHGYWYKTHHLFETVREKTFLKALDENQASTLQAITLHRHLLYSYYFINGELAKAEKEISLLIAYLKKDPERIEDDPGSYVTALGNKIGLLMAGKRWNEIEVLIQTMRNVPAKYKLKGESRFTVRLWLRIFNLELEVYRDTRQLTKGIALIREVEAYMSRHQNILPEDYRIMLCYQAACIYFLKENFTRALYWINEIVNTNFGETRKDLQCYARIMNLMIHFELNNIIVLRYSVDSCRRFFRKKKKMTDFEQTVLALFSRLGHAGSKDYREIFRKFYGELCTTHASIAEKVQDYIDMKAWMESKLKRRIASA